MTDQTQRDEANVTASVLGILRDLTGRADLMVDPATLLADLPDWDSIRQIEAIASAEEAWDVTVQTRDLDRIFTVADIVAAIVRARPA